LRKNAETDAPVEHLLQHRDIHPALVVAQHQVVAVAAQPASPSTCQRMRVKPSNRRLLTPIQLSAISTSTREQACRIGRIGTISLTRVKTNRNVTCSRILSARNSSANGMRMN
jgi:hypothetical protein